MKSHSVLLIACFLLLSGCLGAADQELFIADSLQSSISDDEKIIKKEDVKILPKEENFFEIIVDEADI